MGARPTKTSWARQRKGAKFLTCDHRNLETVATRRAAEGADSWMVAKPFARVVPATTKVLVRTDAGAASVNNDLPPGDGGGGGAGGARRMTRSKHALGAPPLAPSPRRKRSRRATAENSFVLYQTLALPFTSMTCPPVCETDSVN